MRMLAVAVVTLLAAQAAGAQQLAPRNTEPITIHLVNSEFDDAVSFLGRQAGIEVKFDDSASQERRTTKLTVRMEKVTLEEALDTLTRMARLTYKVADPQTVLIYQLP
jgi:type II secretory pathway component GspD/PulD (secretin)